MESSANIPTLVTRWLSRFFLYWVINSAVLWLANALFKGVSFESTTALLKAGIWLAVINSFLKPILVLITLPLTIVTLGLFLILINTLVLFCVEWLVPGMRLGGFWHTAGVSLFISLGILLLGAFIEPKSS
jgi:putative membrane protein